jgi:hypothetical protein
MASYVIPSAFAPGANVARYVATPVVGLMTPTLLELPTASVK